MGYVDERMEWNGSLAKQKNTTLHYIGGKIHVYKKAEKHRSLIKLHEPLGTMSEMPLHQPVL